VQVPSGPPNLRSVAQSLEHPAWDREAAGDNPAVPTKLPAPVLPWPNQKRRSSSKRTDASANLAGSTNPLLPGSVKVAQRPVKP
jgi:hypothetical protein